MDKANFKKAIKDEKDSTIVETQVIKTKDLSVNPVSLVFFNFLKIG